MKKQHFIILTLLLGFAIQAQTAGALTFTFTNPMHSTGNYETNGRYALAVWIETQSGTFIKTKIRYWGTKTNDHLGTWKTKATSNTTDAVTGSTSTNFAAKTITWDGKNVSGTVNGTLVADGAYRVCIQECWGHATATVTRYFNFTKGPTADVQTPAADANFTNISLNWQPTLDTPSTENLPQFTVFPNPSKGIFTINTKNDIKTIRVFNINGAVVYDETITEPAAIELNKTIDLSNVAPGAYIMELSNQYGTQTEKIMKE
ncbi:MAG: hypothetical protein CFE24_00795 [Flavobacterium sp. BFFFF2]|nr:MAG: hypothetical protein CFE24_00795 [Flavobacterium sp. BFFFF2]